MIGLVLAAALAATPAGPETPAGPASPVVVTARAVPDTTTIGSPVRYEIDVSLAPEVEVVFGQPTERLGPFEIVDFGDEPAREVDGRRVVTRWFTLVGFDVGHHLVPSPPIAYRVPGAELAPVEPVETRISVESQVSEDLSEAQLRDIAPPLPVPRDWSGIVLAVGLLVAVAALAGAGWWWSRRCAARALGPPPAPADVRANAALAALAARRLPEQGEVKVYYAELSGIVRRYLEDRFAVRAPEMTTEEFLVATARGAALDATHRGLLAAFLRESDLVKFARHRPTVDVAAGAMDAARRFVAETRPRTGEEAA